MDAGQQLPTVPQRVLIAGAGLGALRTAEQLRANGYAGEIVAIGAEPHLPYSRPPLSKEGLAEGIDHARLAFGHKASVSDVHWRLGEQIQAADLAGHTVELSDGSTIGYDGLVAATGVRARRLDLEAALDQRRTLRTLEDALTLRATLVPGTKVVVIGAGFIGCEVAATARTLGCDVQVVDPTPVPLIRPLGRTVGAVIQRRQEASGVVFRLGRTVTAIAADGPMTWVELDDGSTLPADVVVEAIGSIPNVEWLAGNGLDLSDGVLCDQNLHPLQDGRPVGDVVVVGDIARFPNPLFDDQPRRVEHWNIPTESAKRAAQALQVALSGRPPLTTPFEPMPAFWSDQFDLRLQSFGLPDLGSDDVRVLEGDLDGDAAVGYFLADRIVGVVLLGMTARSLHYRNQILVAAHAR